MPKSTESFNTELDGFLRSRGFENIQTLDTNGKSVPDAGSADQFIFKYTNGSRQYGTVGITTDGGVVTVYYNQEAMKDEDGNIDEQWVDFLTSLKDWALRSGQNTFDTQNFDNLGSAMKVRKKQIADEKLLESWWGNRTTSYSDNVPTIKMVVKHSKHIGEDDRRYHHIDKIFLENSLGERLLVPTKKPSVGRAFARHLAEGGSYRDERWNHIVELAEDADKLSGFVRATRGAKYGGSVMEVVLEAEEKYGNIRESIKRLSSRRGYHSYFESWQPTLMEQDDETDWSELFVTKKMDSRIERALPTLQKLGIRAGHIREAGEFNRWADKILEDLTAENSKSIENLVELLNSGEELPVGADALNAKGQLDGIFPDEDKVNDLFDELTDIARVDPDSDARPAIVAWLQKNSGSEFYREILGRIQEPESDGAVPAEPTQPAPNATAPAPQQPASVQESDDISRIIRLSGIK